MNRLRWKKVFKKRIKSNQCWIRNEKKQACWVVDLIYAGRIVAPVRCVFYVDFFFSESSIYLGFFELLHSRILNHVWLVFFFCGISNWITGWEYFSDWKDDIDYREPGNWKGYWSSIVSSEKEKMTISGM